jgi:hypothetical protein
VEKLFLALSYRMFAQQEEAMLVELVKAILQQVNSQRPCVYSINSIYWTLREQLPGVSTTL